MSESETTCQCNYEDENEHFQIHLIQELNQMNTQLGQANIMKKETHNLMKEYISAIKEQTFSNSLSIIGITICIFAYLSRNN